MSAAAELEAWIARESFAAALEAPETLCAAVDRIVAALGDAVELLGFGEALHGGEEILLLRNRLFQHLVETHGYRAIAVESSLTRGRLVNEYVLGRGPASYDEIREAGFGQGFGRLEATRELVEWMRRYNAGVDESAKVHFYGFDQPCIYGGPASPREHLTPVLDFLAAHDPAAGETHRARIEPLLGADAQWENPMPWRDPAASGELLANATALRGEVEELISALHVRRPVLAQVRDYRAALHDARMTRQQLNFFFALAQSADYAASLAVRDAAMADNLAFIADRERGRGKVFVFAHNMHLQRGEAVWQVGPMRCAWQPAGAHLAALFGPRYAVIGTGLGVSEQNGVAPPEPGTFEAQLLAAPGPIRFFPTQPAPILPTDLPLRSRSPKNGSYFPLTPQSFTDFDLLAVLDAVTYHRGGPPLPS